MTDLNNLKTGTYIVKEQSCKLEPLKPTIEEVTALAWELNNEKIQTRIWKGIAENLAERLEIACSQLPYYDGKEAEDFIEQAKKECGYE